MPSHQEIVFRRQRLDRGPQRVHLERIIIGIIAVAILCVLLGLLFF